MTDRIKAFTIARSNARSIKSNARSIALLDVLMTDDDFCESLDLRELQEREENAHERLRA